MAKFAKGEEKPFDPISNKVLSAIASPIGSLPEEEPPPAPARGLRRTWSAHRSHRQHAPEQRRSDLGSSVENARRQNDGCL